jgi:hypothetical protein
MKTQGKSRKLEYPEWAFNPRVRECWMTGPERMEHTAKQHKKPRNPRTRR